MSHRPPHHRPPKSNRYSSYPGRPPAGNSQHPPRFFNADQPPRFFNIDPPPSQPLFPAQNGLKPQSGASTSYARRDNYQSQNTAPGPSRYQSPEDIIAKKADRIAELEKKLAEMENDEKDTIYLQSAEARCGPAGVETSSDSDDGGCRIVPRKRKAPSPDRVKQEPKAKKEKKDKKHRRRSRSRTRSRSRSRSPRLRTPKYEFLSDNVPYDRHVQPVFITFTSKTIEPKDDVVCPDPPKTLKRVPERLDPKVLNYEFVENHFASCSLDEIPEDGIVKFNSRFDPTNPCGASEYISSNPDPINWDTVCYDDYKRMNHVSLSMFHQSDPDKKAFFFKKSLYECKDDNPQLWIDLIKIQPEIDEQRRRKGQQKGEANVMDLQFSILEAAKKKCSDKVDLDLFEMELLAKQGKLDDAQMEERWDKVVNRHLNNLTVWRRKIAAYKASSKHTVNQILNRCYFRCLQKLGGLLDGSIKSHKLLPGTEEFVLEVLQAAFALLLESGNTQKAIAILQAYVEFYFFAPPRVEQHFQKKFEVFEYFWNSPIFKVGTPGSQTWGSYVVSQDLKNYDQTDNAPQYVDGKRADVEINDIKRSFVTLKAAVAKLDDAPYVSESIKWVRTEIARSNAVWKPTLCHHKSGGAYFAPLYVPFSQISDTLIRYTNPNSPVKAVFSMLVQLGATIPGVEDMSESAMCDIALSELKVFDYEGMDAFFENVLKHLENVNSGMLLRCKVARILTYASYVPKHTSDFKEAKQKITTFIKELMREYKFNDQERKAVMTFYHEAVDKLSRHYGISNNITQQMWSMFITNDSDKLFKNELIAADLLITLRFAVTMCRILPYSTQPNQIEGTKLSVITEMSAKVVNDVTDFERLRQVWQSIRKVCIAKSNAIAAEHSWMGCIENYYTELLAILYYETEASVARKWNAFASCFTLQMLASNEYLNEVYYSTWFYHIQKYNVSKNPVMAELTQAVNRFPLNVKLIRILAQCLPIDQIRSFFAQDAVFDSTNDVCIDRIRVLRTIVQFMPLRKLWDNSSMQDALDHAMRTQHFIDLVRDTAISASQASLRPDSFLWRLLVYISVFFDKRGEDISTIYVEARQHCIWSKEFLVFFHLKTCTKLLESSLAEADTTGIRINYSALELKQK